MIQINVFNSKQEMGEAAANKAAGLINDALKGKGKAFLITATGASQFEFLNSLIKHNEIEWSKVEMFHLDEYLDISEDNPASFRKYLKERFVDHLRLGAVHFIKGDAPDPILEKERIGNLISQVIIDVVFVGIGENGHLAFNDPPADFSIEEPYIIVDLDDKCRQQQVGEGWFKSINEVPKKAISMSINEILRANNIICVCPDERKAYAVKNCLREDQPISPNYPASALKKHNRVYCYLDKSSASLLK